jgi:hypothetical protein
MFRRRRQLHECGIGVFHPVDDLGPRHQAFGGRHVMPQLRREEPLDLEVDRGASSRPAHAEPRAQRSDHALPVRKQGIIGHHSARQVACRALRIDHVTQPHERGFGERKTVALPQRGHHLQRIAHRDRDCGRGAEFLEDVAPERKEPAGAGILDHEQPRLRIIVPQHAEDPLLERGGVGRGVPVRIECAPVVPIGAGGLEQLVVNDHQVVRLEVSGFVGKICRHDIARQIGPEQTDNPCQRRSAAAMHTENEDRPRPRIGPRTRRPTPSCRLRLRTANTAPRCSRFDRLLHPEILRSATTGMHLTAFLSRRERRSPSAAPRPPAVRACAGRPCAPRGHPAGGAMSVGANRSSSRASASRQSGVAMPKPSRSLARSNREFAGRRALVG